MQMEPTRLALLCDPVDAARGSFATLDNLPRRIFPPSDPFGGDFYVEEG
jgi:hypothetical protein